MKNYYRYEVLVPSSKNDLSLAKSWPLNDTLHDAYTMYILFNLCVTYIILNYNWIYWWLINDNIYVIVFKNVKKNNIA